MVQSGHEQAKLQQSLAPYKIGAPQNKNAVSANNLHSGVVTLGDAGALALATRGCALPVQR